MRLIFCSTVSFVAVANVAKTSVYQSNTYEGRPKRSFRCVFQDKHVDLLATNYFLMIDKYANNMPTMFRIMPTENNMSTMTFILTN